MERVIHLIVTGSEVFKDRIRAGVRGEANATNLHITFDDSWDNYAKTVTWWDAVERNPVKRTLTADLLEDISLSTRVYLCPIPGEPLAVEGECTLVIAGYMDGKRARSVAVRLLVDSAPIADQAGEPSDPNPTQAEQLQGQIETLLGDISAQAAAAKEARAGAEAARDAAQAVEMDAQAAAQSAQDAKNYAEAASGSAGAALESAAAADRYMSSAGMAADDAISAKESIENMEVAASTLPAGADASVEKTVDGGVVKLTFGLPRGDAGGVSDPVRYNTAQQLSDEQKRQARDNIGALGGDDLSDAVNTALAQAKQSGEFDGADGYSPVRGTDYWTPEDQNAMVDSVLAALPNGDEVSY